MLPDKINELRQYLGPRESRRDPRYLKELASRVSITLRSVKDPIVECFVEDLLSFEQNGKLIRTKQCINAGESRYVLSLFDSSYFPSLSLDCFTYTTLEVHDDLPRCFKSNACPVIMGHHSLGFGARTVVALFPENHIDRRQDTNDRVFYFIDKFVERHQRITQKMLKYIVDSDDLDTVRRATHSDMQRAACHWVWLHEYHHRQGNLPLPQYLCVKSLKPLAGLEELRVDIEGMLVCRAGCHLSPELAELTFQFILSERLLRYPVEGRLRPNYDAVASQMLFNYLCSCGAITVEGGLIHLKRSLPSALRELLDAINAIERGMDQANPFSVQQPLLNFVHRYVERDPASLDYRHIDFFVRVKQRLAI
jgi:hypothetical protein